jgi:hypothetical protein
VTRSEVKLGRGWRSTGGPWERISCAPASVMVSVRSEAGCAKMSAMSGPTVEGWLVASKRSIVTSCLPPPLKGSLAEHYCSYSV